MCDCTHPSFGVKDGCVWLHSSIFWYEGWVCVPALILLLVQRMGVCCCTHPSFGAKDGCVLLHSSFFWYDNDSGHILDTGKYCHVPEGRGLKQRHDVLIDCNLIHVYGLTGYYKIKDDTNTGPILTKAG